MKLDEPDSYLDGDALLLVVLSNTMMRRQNIRGQMQANLADGK